MAETATSTAPTTHSAPATQADEAPALKARLREALGPILALVKTIDPDSPDAARRLQAALPADAVSHVRQLVREGIKARTLADRENGGVRFDRIAKPAEADGYAIDVVFMGSKAFGGGAEEGGAHTHPEGEIDLCFPVAGDPRFDGHGQGMAPCVVVFGKGSHHTPTVTGGTMDILYFLPGGKIAFDPPPAG